MFKKYEYYLPNLSQCLLLLLFFLLGGVAIAPLLFLLGDSLNIDRQYLEPLGYLFTYIPLFIYIRAKSISAMSGTADMKDPIRSKINSPDFGTISPVLFFILITILLFAASNILDPVMLPIKMPEWYLSKLKLMGEERLVLSLITTVILAPLLEELFCRGIMLRGLLHHQRPHLAIFCSSFLFAFIHMNFYQGVPAFVIGYLMGWIYYKSGSIWAVIYLHCINNLSSLIIIQKHPEYIYINSVREVIPHEIYYTLIILSLIVAVWLILYINKHLKNRKNEDTKIISL